MGVADPEYLISQMTPLPRTEGWAVRTFTHPVALVAELAAWSELAQGASEPNPFYEPWFFLPALKALADHDSEWRIIVLEQTVKNRTHWAGFFPFQITGSRWAPWGWKLQLWKHPQCYLTTPLIASGQEPEVLDRLMAYLKHDPSFPSVMHWPVVAAGGPIERALIDIARRDQLTVHIHESHNRAMHSPWMGDDSEEACHKYLLKSLGGHHLRELRRQRRRLTEAGDLEFRSLRNRSQLGVWSDWFLKLEAAGWKGREGTAFDCDPALRQFFHELIDGGFDRGAIEMFGLFQKGEPLAIKLNILSGAGGFSYKIAYDERFAKLSPGVQLEMDHLQHFQASGRKWIDSCASADHSMINRLWADRRTVHHLLISTGRWSSDLGLSAIPLLRGVLRTGRRALRWIKTLATRKASVKPQG